MRYMLIALVACSLLAACGAARETAALDSFGRLTALIYGGGDELALRSGVMPLLSVAVLFVLVGRIRRIAFA